MAHRILYLFLFSIINISFSFGNNIDFGKGKSTYHSVVAKNGDGVYSLLRRYQLNSNSCDVKKFYELNSLKKDQALIVNKVYILPVLLFSYNGVSIRSSIDDNDWDKAIRIKKYNEFLLKMNLRKKSFRKSKILWVPYHETGCDGLKEDLPKKEEEEKLVESVKEQEPKASKTNLKDSYYKLFGKKHGKFTMIDNTLKNQVYYVVSGHGGPDPGAQCTSCASTLCEDEYAYDVALRLTRDLMQHGAIVHMIIQDANDGIRDEQYLACDHDETCMGKKIPLDQVKRLHQRTSSINKLYARYKKQGVKKQKAIMIHVDSNHAKTKQDTYFYYFKSSKSGKKLAYDIQSTFKSKYEKYQKGRGYSGSVRTRGLYMLRNTHPTAVYVELGNIKNKKNQERLLLESNRQALANWLFEGLIK